MSRDGEGTRAGAAVMRAGSPALASWFRPQLLIAFAIFVAFWLFKLADFYPAIDDEYAAFRPTSVVWVTQGRWAAYLFERLVLPRTTIPYFPLLLFGAFVTVAYFVLLSVHRVERVGAVHLAAFPLFCAFPTWVFMAAFSSNIAAAGLATLCACLAIHCFRRATDGAAGARSRALRLSCFAASIALGAFATGVYQTFLLALAVIGLGAILTDALQRAAPPRAVLKDAGLLAVAVAGALALHGIAQRLTVALLGLASGRFVDKTFGFEALVAMPLESIVRTLKFVGLVYGGSEVVYGAASPAFAVLLGCGIAAIGGAARIGGASRILLLALAALLLCLPFAPYVLYGWDLPIRSLVAVPAAVWLFAMLGLTSGRRWLELATSAVLVWSLFELLHSASLVEAPATFVREHDRALAAEVYRRIVELHPDFDRTRTYLVDFYGDKRFESPFRRPQSSTLGYSFFEWDGGSMGRILRYMQLLGYTNLAAPDAKRREADLAVFTEMPLWPAQGSVRVVGDVTLVKLGAEPGWPFNAR